MKLVNDVFTSDIHNLSVRFDQKVSSVINTSGFEKSGCVFITDNENNFKGMITDRELRQTTNHKQHLLDATIETFINANQDTTTLSESIDSVLYTMRTKLIDTMPVLDNKQLIGYIDYHSIVKRLSPERIYFIHSDDAVTERFTENEIRHRARYFFARQHIKKNAKILDCSCGSGYGSNILSKDAHTVLGVDISEESIAFARETYTNSNINFCIQDIKTLTYAEHSFDAIISLETLEHISFEDCKAFIKKCSYWLKPGGTFVGSSPMLRYRNGKPYITNPYHINELPRADLLKMLNQTFDGFRKSFFHQKQDKFNPLMDEDEGFCLFVARKHL